MSLNYCLLKSIKFCHQNNVIKKKRGNMYANIVTTTCIMEKYMIGIMEQLDTRILLQSSVIQY